MFASVEKYSGPAKVLLGLIALTFVGFGVSTVAAPGSDFIIKVGDQKVSQNDVNQALQNAQAGGGSESRDAVLQSLLQRAYLIQGAQDMGISVSQEQLKQIIVDDPSFHDAEGKFSQALLNQYLSQRHLSEDQFVAEIRQQFALQNMMNLVQNGTLVSDAQAAQLVNLMQAERTIRTITFSPQAFASQVKIDDKLMQDYYNKNKKDYVIPEAVKLEYVALNVQDLAAKQTVSEQELREAFAQESQSVQPKREIAHILFPVAQDADDAQRAQAKAEAEKVLAEVKAKPANFAALAKKYSKDPASSDNGGNLGYFAKNGGLGKEFEDVAFSLPKGEISEVVQTAYGYHIITILNIQNQPVFEQEKARLEAELKQKRAAAEFNKAKQQLAEEAFNSPDSLAEVAKKVGLKLESPPDWLTKENGKAAGMSDDLLNTIFSEDVMKKKHNSEPVSVNENTVWVVRAKEVRPESAESFEKAKETVRMDYLRTEASKLAETKAKQALVDLNSGENPKLDWSAVSQLTAEQARQSMPPEAYRQLMKARPSEGKPAYVLLEGLPAPVLMEVQAIKAPENIEAQLPQARQILMQTSINSVFDGLLGHLQKSIKQKQGAQKLDGSE